MAELVAVGFAANIVQFIGVAFSAVSSAVQIYKSASGMTSENSALLENVSCLKETCGRLSTLPSAISKHPALGDLSGKCLELSKELEVILNSLAVKGQKSPLKSFNSLVKYRLKKSKIDDIRGRLGGYRELVLLELNILLE